MTVTRTEPCGKTKYRIYLDGEPAFILYKGEMKKLDIREGQSISRETEEQIRSEILLRRAKLRAMHLLEDMDRTETELRDKLRRGEYPDDVVEKAIDYVSSFGYIDDVRYAENYILGRKDLKSRREIRAVLAKKGISGEDIEQAFSACYSEDSEAEAERSILRKRKFSPESADRAQMQKMYGYLARKGFRYEVIRQVIQNADENA